MSFEQNESDDAGEQKGHLETKRQRSGREPLKNVTFRLRSGGKKLPEVETAT